MSILFFPLTILSFPEVNGIEKRMFSWIFFKEHTHRDNIEIKSEIKHKHQGRKKAL